MLHKDDSRACKTADRNGGLVGYALPQGSLGFRGASRASGALRLDRNVLYRACSERTQIGIFKIKKKMTVPRDLKQPLEQEKGRRPRTRAHLTSEKARRAD
jgi:hypothetical protein